MNVIKILTFHHNYDVIGYECEEHNNPADFFLDVINGDTFKTIVNDNEVIKDENDVIQNNNDVKNDETVGRELKSKSSEDFVRIAAELNGKYLNSEAKMRLDKEFEVIGDAFQSLFVF